MSEQNSIKDLYFSPDGKNSFFELVRDNLFEGQEFKNFNSLCRVLELDKPYPRGNAKIRHFAAWRCFFEFEYIPDTYRIRIGKINSYDEIKEYDSPFSNGETRDSNKQKPFHYNDYIIPLLENYSARNGYPYNLIFSRSELYVLLGFVNESYLDLRDKVLSLQKKKIKEQDNIEFFEIQRTISKLLTSETMRDQFKSMNKKNILIDIHDVYLIKHEGESVILKATNEQANMIANIKNRISDSKEDRYNGEDPISVYMMNNMLTNVELKENNIDFELCAIKKELIFSRENFKPQILNDEMVEIYRHILNDYFIEKRLIPSLEKINIYGKFNVMNPKYKGRTAEDIKQDMIKTALNYCQI